MKARLKFGLVFITLLMGGFTIVKAQPTNKPAFWVIEGNVNLPDYTIIRFYDAQAQLIKEERIAGKFLDIRKKRNQKLLNKKLDDLVNPRSQVAVHKAKIKRSIP